MLLREHVDLNSPEGFIICINYVCIDFKLIK